MASKSDMQKMAKAIISIREERQDSERIYNNTEDQFTKDVMKADIERLRNLEAGVWYTAKVLDIDGPFTETLIELMRA